MLIYQDIKIPHLQIAQLEGNLEVGNIKIHCLLFSLSKLISVSILFSQQW